MDQSVNYKIDKLVWHNRRLYSDYCQYQDDSVVVQWQENNRQIFALFRGAGCKPTMEPTAPKKKLDFTQLSLI